MLNHSAGIPVKNNRLRRNFHNIVNRTETGCHIYQLNIRFSLGGRIAQRADPHGIKLSCFPILIDNCIFHNKAGQSTVSLHGTYCSLHLYGFS